MGITHVLRGEDHLTNTPRQLLVLEALELRAPTYGHLSLLVGADGSPLSKRHGATSVREFRERGYLPVALANHLFRLGHSSSENGVLTARRHGARVHGQTSRVARRRASRNRSSTSGSAKSRITCRSRRASAGSRPRRRATSTPSAAALSSPPSGPNVLLPSDVARWRDVVFGAAPALDDVSLARVREAGAAVLPRGRRCRGHRAANSTPSSAR